MWTIVDMLLCNATHITLHRTRVLYNMEEVKKKYSFHHCNCYTTEHKSSATWKQFKKESVQSVQFLSPEYTGSSATRKQFKKESVQSVQFLSPEYTGSSVRSTLPPSIASSRTQDVQILFNKEKEIEEEKKIWNNKKEEEKQILFNKEKEIEEEKKVWNTKEREKEEEKQILFIKGREMEKGKRSGTKRKRRMKK